MTPAEIEVKITLLTKELAFWQHVSKDRRCNKCANWDGSGCKLAGGLVPPDEVQRNGCPAWVWDDVPFNLEAHDNL